MDLNPQNYPRMGISHKMSLLSGIGPLILWFPQAEQAKLADAICRRYADDVEFNNMQSTGDIKPPHDFAPQLGNIAYMALHCHPDYRKRWEEIYEDWMSILTELYRDYVTISEKQQIRNSKLPEPFPETAAYSMR